eukprot:729408-Hanusia_phi.AAC.1
MKPKRAKALLIQQNELWRSNIRAHLRPRPPPRALPHPPLPRPLCSPLLLVLWLILICSPPPYEVSTSTRGRCLVVVLMVSARQGDLDWVYIAHNGKLRDEEKDKQLDESSEQSQQENFKSAT